VRRCQACGAFFDGDECPTDHSDIPGYTPPQPVPYPELSGKVVRYEWPGSGPVNCVIVDEPDEDGKVGLMVLNAHVRVNPDDVEEI
jgi:hypothetical protein